MMQKFKNIYHLFQAFFSALYFRFPAKNLKVIAVTGTDGKTTTVNMINHILRSQNFKSSMVSSVNAEIGKRSLETGFHVTTPSSWQLQKLLSMASKEGSEFFVLEATSHGLDQNRLAYIDIDCAAVTNITSEHMDYHKTWQNYALAKSKLFNNCKVAVLNLDDKSYDFLKNKVNSRVITYSRKKEADVNLKKYSIKLKIEGDYNLDNALCASAVSSFYKVTKAETLKSLETFKGVEGRMQKINAGQDFEAVIDFAHTQNSLKQALISLNKIKKANAKLICVFGAAGKRDDSKRKPMGEVSAQLADITIITAEDPRTESAQKIAEDIKKGLTVHGKRENKDFFIEIDRSRAIELAVQMAKKDDIVAFFGKGHEKSMCIGAKEYPWNEEEEVTKAISKLK